MPRETQMIGSLAEYMRSREVYRSDALAILVDGFRRVREYVDFGKESWHGGGKPSEMKPLRVLFFLSHFHSDHYSGITQDWCRGTIYASRATANVLRWRLGVRESCVKCMEISTTYVFSLANGELLFETPENTGCHENCFSVTAVPASHCPGAVMFLFRSVAFGIVLHTGDFRFTNGRGTSPAPRVLRSRWDLDIAEDPLLNAVAGQVDVLFLDNTFCDTPFEFPSRADVLQRVNMEILSAFSETASLLSQQQQQQQQQQQRDDESRSDVCEAKGRTVCLAVFIGTYFIGKERIAFSIQETFLPSSVGDAEATPFIPTYVSSEKLESMRHLECHPERFQSISRSSDVIAEGGEKVLSGFGMHEVRLPQDTSTPQHTVARNLFSSSPPNINKLSSEKTKYYLVLFLVPLSSVAYPALAAACGGGRPKRRRGSDTCSNGGGGGDGECLDRELLSLWDNNVIDLRQFDAALCVEPTGWTKKVTKQRVSRRVTLLRVPYSEHSSFSELLDFVGFVNPRCIVPTVSLELFKKHEVLFAQRAPRLLQRYSNVQPLSRFLKPNTLLKEELVPEAAADGMQMNGMTTQKQRNPFATKTRTTTKATESIFIDDDDDDNDSLRRVQVSSAPPVALADEAWGGKPREAFAVAGHGRGRILGATVTTTASKDDVAPDHLDSTRRLRCPALLDDKCIGKGLKSPPPRASSTTEGLRIDKDDDDDNGDDEGGDSNNSVLVEIRPSFIDVSDSSD